MYLLTSKQVQNNKKSQQVNTSVLAMKISNLGQRKSPFAGAKSWSVGDSNSRPLPCEGSALNQLS